MKLNNPLVSVVMITYGHENYIRNAIEGVLVQKCEFEIELIIADDCSPDKTKLIVEEILNTNINSNWIKYFRHKKNIGMQDNFLFALNTARGKFIAVCEGDDYWTDPLKLQKQVDVLNANDEYSLCFHNAKLLRGSESKNELFRISKKNIYKTKDVILDKWICPTASIVFRSEVSRDPIITNIEEKVKNGDLVTLFTASLYGKLFYIDDIMSVYRCDVQGGATNFIKKKSKLYLNHMAYLNYINKSTKYKYVIYILIKKSFILAAYFKSKMFDN